jgi:hypothetical protein
MVDMNEIVLVLSGIFFALIGADLATDYQKGEIQQLLAGLWVKIKSQFKH